MSDELPQTPAPSDRREAVREKAAQVQTQQRRRRVARISIVSIVVVALVAVAGIAVASVFITRANQPELAPRGLVDDAVVVDAVPSSVLASFSSGRATPTPNEADPTAAPAEASAPADPVKIDVYVDYMSEVSAAFQAANAKQLTEWITEGAATISYHPVALLTSKSNGTKYSMRAAAAAACVATSESESFFAFHHALLGARPELDTDGHSDAQLADLAIASGAENPKRVRRCIEDQHFASWAQQATTRALAAPLGETDAPLAGPITLVNGQPYVGAADSAKEFAQFVLTLASDAYFTSTPSPTPTPTPAP